MQLFESNRNTGSNRTPLGAADPLRQPQLLNPAPGNPVGFGQGEVPGGPVRQRIAIALL